MGSRELDAVARDVFDAYDKAELSGRLAECANRRMIEGDPAAALDELRSALGPAESAPDRIRRAIDALSEYLGAGGACRRCGGKLVALGGDETFEPRLGCVECNAWANKPTLRGRE